MSDRVYEAFLESARQDVAACVAASDILNLQARDVASQHVYDGRLIGVEHLVRRSDGTVAVSAGTVEFTFEFPPDYCRSTDPTLQFRVARVSTPMFHPNVRGGLVCLGPHFRPGTRARGVVEHVYRIFSGRVRATDHGFDADACRYYIAHPEQVAALRAAPLWRRDVAVRERREPVARPPSGW